MAACCGKDEFPARRVVISPGNALSAVELPLSGVVEERFPDLNLVAMRVSESGSDAVFGVVLFMSRCAIGQV